LLVLENGFKVMQEEFKKLSVEFETLQLSLEHFVTQHLHPQQSGGRACECPHAYFCPTR
jgi:hypothetical protein